MNNRWGETQRQSKLLLFLLFANRQNARTDKNEETIKFYLLLLCHCHQLPGDV